MNDKNKIAEGCPAVLILYFAFIKEHQPLRGDP